MRKHVSRYPHARVQFSTWCYLVANLEQLFHLHDEIVIFVVAINSADDGVVFLWITFIASMDCFPVSCDFTIGNFTIIFWRAVFKRLNTMSNLSTVSHPPGRMVGLNV